MTCWANMSFDSTWPTPAGQGVDSFKLYGGLHHIRENVGDTQWIKIHTFPNIQKETMVNFKKIVLYKKKLWYTSLTASN